MILYNSVYWKDMKNEIYLESVGSVLVEGIIYPAYPGGGYDVECGTPLEECTEEWYSSLSNKDLTLI